MGNTNTEKATSKIQQAQEILLALNFDTERQNERSALVLLALAEVHPESKWSSAKAPSLRTVEIMETIRSSYGRDYKPNTRETIRRQTLHQFVDAGLILQNPDDPSRPVNSPKWCYQLSDPALKLLNAYGQSGFQSIVEEYLVNAPGLRAQYAVERDMNRIPVTLADGREITLSPGGQNTLIKSMVEDFCSYYAPGGKILYLGDADSKWAVSEEATLKGLGVEVDHHGKMPDLVVFMPDKNWLVLLEAASSHGPVDAKRHAELSKLFSGAEPGLVFVSCFPTRAEMRKYLADIAWESEVWCADSPTHLIHFNGERFLGPYDS
jgi:hypothetical protein